MKVLKAGCIVVDMINKKIALIYRENRKDYSFPKGHLEANESLIECAIRETEEEIKRVPILIKNEPIIKEKYYDSNNDEVDMNYFLAKDGGLSSNDSLDSHELLWVSIDEVEDLLTYPSLKNIWNQVKGEVEKLVSNVK